jgi:hypothetical protein
MEGVDFFILQCTKKMHIVEEDEKEDVWKGQFESRDEVVEGVMYSAIEGISYQYHRCGPVCMLEDKG